ncbi:g10198 [Coccomyxa viridis]|uniref:G10198 protein n=1 Tax=Coccomyxa viridis TaxID=1274662 RepID=A0ABP1G7F8_9CHLO
MLLGNSKPLPFWARARHQATRGNCTTDLTALCGHGRTNTARFYTHVLLGGRARWRDCFLDQAASRLAFGQAEAALPEIWSSTGGRILLKAQKEDLSACPCAVYNTQQGELLACCTKLQAALVLFLPCKEGALMRIVHERFATLRPPNGKSTTLWMDQEHIGLSHQDLVPVEMDRDDSLGWPTAGRLPSTLRRHTLIAPAFSGVPRVRGSMLLELEKLLALLSPSWLLHVGICGKSYATTGQE